MTPIKIEPELQTLLRRLKLGRLLDTLPERLANARQQKTPHHEFLLLLLSDEVSRRDAAAVTLRSQRAHIDPDARFERWDDTAAVQYDKELLNELASLRFVEAHQHVAIVGPVGVPKHVHLYRVVNDQFGG